MIGHDFLDGAEFILQISIDHLPFFVEIETFCEEFGLSVCPEFAA